MLTLKEKSIFFDAFGYKPNPLQEKIHALPNRIVQVAGGERAGKSKVGAEDLSAEAAANPGLYWIVGPDYAQARPEFNYCLENLTKIDAVADSSIPKEGSCSLTIRGGAQIITKSGEDAVKLASFAPKGILMVEAAQQTFENFQKLVNRTAETRGWLKATGTFESSLGWYAEMFTALQARDNLYDGVSISLPTWSNTAIFPGGESDPEIIRLRATNDPDLFLERFGGVPCPPRGVVFKEFKHIDHVMPIAFASVEASQRTPDGWLLHPDTRVELWIDPGYAGAYSVVFAAVDGPRVFLLDEVYGVGVVAEQMILETMQRGDLFQRVMAAQRKNGVGGVIDVAGRAHAGMESHEEIWRRMAGVVFRSQMVPIVDGISRHRTFLRDPLTSVPRLYHHERCRGTIKEYGLYRYRDESPNRPQTELPIDKNNHSMKAIAYGLVANYGFVDRARTVPINQKNLNPYDREVERAFTAAGKRRQGNGWLA